MSGSCRNPQSEPIAQHNKIIDEQDERLHKSLRSALIPPEALKEIELLQAAKEVLETNRDVASQEYRDLQAELKTAKAFAWHKPFCKFFGRPAIARREDCTCGYFELRKE